MQSIASRRMVQLIASFTPPGTSFEAASRRLRTRGLEVTTTRKWRRKPLKSLKTDSGDPPARGRGQGESIRPTPYGSPDARVIKRSLVIAGHRTSVSLEDAFWRRLRAIAAERGLSLNGLAAMIAASRDGANLSSAIRVFVLEAEGARPSRPAGDGAAPPDQ